MHVCIGWHYSLGDRNKQVFTPGRKPTHQTQDITEAHLGESMSLIGITYRNRKNCKAAASPNSCPTMGNKSCKPRAHGTTCRMESVSSRQLCVGLSLLLVAGLTWKCFLAVLTFYITLGKEGLGKSNKFQWLPEAI